MSKLIIMGWMKSRWNKDNYFKNIFITPKLYHTLVTLFETEAQLAGTQETALAQTDIS